MASLQIKSDKKWVILSWKWYTVKFLKWCFNAFCQSGKEGVKSWVGCWVLKRKIEFCYSRSLARMQKFSGSIMGCETCSLGTVTPFFRSSFVFSLSSFFWRRTVHLSVLIRFLCQNNREPAFVCKCDTHYPLGRSARQALECWPFLKLDFPSS